VLRGIERRGDARIASGPDAVNAVDDESGADREQALDRARAAVAAFAIMGPKTNLAFHAELLASPQFLRGDYDTSLVSKLRPR